MSFPYRSRAPLPDEVIDRLFSALVVRYGSPFTDRWRDLDLAIVKGDWARELGGFDDNRGAIRYALDNLPEKPPTVIEFRKLCNAAPATYSLPMLGYNPDLRGPTPEEREKLRAMAADIRAGEFFAKPSRRWAYELIRRHEQEGFDSTPAALKMARDAIASDPDRGAHVSGWGTA